MRTSVPITFLLAGTAAAAAAAAAAGASALPSGPLITEPRVINGEPAERGEFPWQAELRRDGKHICAAALVSQLWLVTAAHCLTPDLDTTAYQVILGEYDVTVEEGSEQRRSIAEMVFFTNNSSRLPLSDENDIALVKLDKPAIYTQYVKAIALPDSADDFTGLMAIASGWGVSGSTAIGPVFPDVLQKMPMMVMSDEDCLKSLNFFNFVPGPMSCAVPPVGSSLCWGDSGGALTYYASPDRPLLAAITSWGVDCDLSKMPTVFVDVAFFTEWIRGVLGGGSVDKE